MPASVQDQDESSRANGEDHHVSAQRGLWILGSLCALHQRNFDPALVLHEFPPPCDDAWLQRTTQALGFRSKRSTIQGRDCSGLPLPVLVTLKVQDTTTVGLITAANAQNIVLFTPGETEPQTLTHAEVDRRLIGKAWLFAPEPTASAHADGSTGDEGHQHRDGQFGFKWFVPELLRHRSVWRDVLLASLALQLVTLATPLFTQAIIDKVVVHRTQSTLVAIGLAMGMLTIFSALLGWGRQYLVLHTGNRVDAVLGAAVWEHLLRLPLRYFEHRPSGVIAARLHAVENIREFVSGAAVSLVLDLPFLIIALGLMLYYSVLLSAISVGILSIIAVASLVMAPIFQRQLNDQFLLSARNQAFVTEHIAGFETVKTLQMEPQLRKTYSGYIASLLHSAFQTKQIANTYNTFANALQQSMTLAVLIVGAWLVMDSASQVTALAAASTGNSTNANDPAAAQASQFTVGMLVAFQMFAGKLSEPVLRIVGLWTQFQQASLSVQRLGDVMNAPTEPYSLTPRRHNTAVGADIHIQGLAFRYSPERPLLYQDLHLSLKAGQSIALMGPSGSGKSTLAKLLLGFYQPTAGRILIDGVDMRALSANELRATFGVVPQETMLFSGTVLHNLQLGNPQASFAQVVQAAKLAGIHHTIEQLPQGYETEIGERGAGLSGGQKQRLAIARALIKRPKVLIFDEATSALDANTAEEFAKTINQLKAASKGRLSMIFITHALPSALAVDNVVRIGPIKPTDPIKPSDPTDPTA